MRKNKDFKTYGRHRNRIISTDVWVSDNDKRRNVFSTSSELDSSSKQSSIFSSSSSSERSGESSGCSVFQSSEKTRPKDKQTSNKENVPSSRKKTEPKRVVQQKVFSISTSSVSSCEADRVTKRRPLRDRNKNIDYNDSANMKKQLRGTTAKRKRAVKTQNEKPTGDSVNFSEFDEYSLVISDSPVIDFKKPSRQELIETSTPVAKRTRGKEINSSDRITNSDLSHIETVEASPVPDSSYSLYTSASSLPNGISMASLSTPSIHISPVALYDQLSTSSYRTESQETSISSPIQSPENAVVQLEKLRNSFVLKHVVGRRKPITNSELNKKSNIPEETHSRTPEDVRVTLHRLTSSFIDSHSSGKKSHSSRLTEEQNNSQSLFDSPYVPYILTRNRVNNAHKIVKSAERGNKNNLSVHSMDSEDESDSEDCEELSANELDEEEEEEEEEHEEEEEEEEEDNVEDGIGNLSAINEDEEDCSENDEDESDIDSSDNDEISQLQNSMKDLQISGKSSRSSEETLYRLNPDYNPEENGTSDDSELRDSEESYQVSGSRDLFSTYAGSSRISLRSAKNLSTRSDYVTASSANVSEEGDFETASDGENEDDADSGDDSEDVREDVVSEDDDNDVEEAEEDERDRSMDEEETNSKVTSRSYSLRDKHLLSFQDSFKELLTPSKKKNSLVPLSARTKLLVLCNQSEPVTFTQAIPQKMLLQCKKIGEGVYGEVYRTCDVALKIIPIEGDFTVNDEPQKKFEEILPEVVIAKELSSLRHCKTNMATNFCEVKSVSLVKGSYPAKLLKEWDLYDKRKGSENDRPNIFQASQLFILFEFADCGRDLEAFEFENMQQARSVLAQVVYSLAVAEDSLQFEHRDLHWGNILVKPTDREDITFKLMGKRCSVPSMGVEANIIDFTLSRLTKDKCSVYTDLSEDDSLFEGKGDYQFDIYRKMKEENSNNWEKFHPYSNVLWLHYLADKLVYAKKYPSQTSRQDRDIIRQFRQFLGTMLDYQSACHMAVEGLFLNS